MSEYLLGMDCGGTRIQAVAYSLTGEVLLKKTGGSSNLVVHYENSKQEIIRMIQTIQLELKDKQCRFALLGIAGLDSGGFYEALYQELTPYLSNFELINDGQLAYWNRLEGQEGMLVVAGTGSVITGYFDQKWVRVGGWGHLLGDQGSAYWLGQQAAVHLLAQVDKAEPLSLLSQAILDAFEVESPLDFVKIFYQSEKAQIAELAQVVAQLDQKDFVAKQLLIQAGIELANQVLVLAARYPRQQYAIGLNGSVIEKNSIVRTHFEATMSKKIKVNIQKTSAPNARGVLFYFQKNRNKIS